MAESLIGKKVKFVKARLDKDGILADTVSEIVFEGKISFGDGFYMSVIGLKNGGELVLDERLNLRLFGLDDGEGHKLDNFKFID